MIKIAVLSDLHISNKDDKTQDRIFENIINFFEGLISEGNWIDLVLVTGDITSTGSEEEFNKALNFFNRLRASLDILNENFIFIGGNHDYNRKELDIEFKYVEKPNLEMYKEIFNSKAFHNHINNAFSNFNLFLKKFLGKIPPLTDYKLKFSLYDLIINITVLNSSLINTIGEDNLPLYVDIENLRKITDEKDGSDLSIFIMHHPISYLFIENRHQLDAILNRSCHVLISGHEHIPDYSIKKDVEGNEYISIINGSTFLTKGFKSDSVFYRFMILEFDSLFNQIKIIPYFTLPRILHCGRDTSLYSSGKEDGIIFLPLGSGIQDFDKEKKLDPLEKYEIPEIFLDFFKKRFNELMNATNKTQLLKLRKEIKKGQQYTLNRISFYFIKYLIKNKIIIQYEQLKMALDQLFLFSLIRNLRDKILRYYNTSYFEKVSKDLKKILSIRHKKSNITKLREELQFAEEKIKDLEKKKKSILEMYHIRPIDLLPKLNYEDRIEITEHFKWYNKFGLLSDPFPSNDGLENIQEEFFEKVIYPTSTIEQFKTILITDDISDLLNKTIGIYGPFGSGKTTLFQYIERLISIYHEEIIVIFISLEARATLDEIRRKFFLKLNLQLTDIHLNELQYSIPEVDLEEDCINMLKSLSTKKKFLFIFIEDIYKHSGRKDYFDEVIGFIKALQIYRKDFTSSGVKTSFFFSAISEIVEKIRRDHSISGGVDNYQKMATIDLETALAMINLRLEAFAKDLQNPPKVSREYLSRLKQIAKQNGTPIITFRDYIDILLDRFRRLEFTEDSITIESDDQVILSIQKDLEAKHKNINQSFKFLMERSKNDRIIFEQFISILDGLWSEDPIIEGDKLFYTNKPFLIHLMQTNLIKKIEFNKKIGWTISDEGKEYFNKLLNQYGLFPSSIIPSVFFAKEKLVIPENKYLIALENVIKRSEDYGSEFLKFLKSAKDTYEKVENLSTSINILKKDYMNETIINLIQESFSSFMIAFVIQCDKDVSNYNTALRQYENSWYEDLEIVRFARRFKDYVKVIQHSKEENIILLREYLSSVKIMVSALKRFVQWDTVFSLKNKKIWKSDKKLLNSIRKNIESNNLGLAKTKLFNLMRRKLKFLIYNLSVILYGYEKWRRGLPEVINKKLKTMINNIRTTKKIDEKDLLLRLKVEELFRVIEFLNTKTNTNIKILDSINSLSKKILPQFSKKNIWVSEILVLIEAIDSFYECLLTGNIESPWNSREVMKLEDIKKEVDYDSILSEKIFSKLPIVLDMTLRPLHHYGFELDLRSLASWAISNNDRIDINTLYHTEQFVLKKCY